MASKKKTSDTTPSASARQDIERPDNDNVRWIVGLVLLFIGVFVAAAVFFSFFNWDIDQSGLMNPEQRQLLQQESANPCGWSGARLGKWLVDDSFGVAGIILPLLLALVGVRIIQQIGAPSVKKGGMKINQTILSAVLVVLLLSLTLGFALADRWSVCSSTGWGGSFGIEIASMLKMNIGALGTSILLLVGWILTGVFINRNFIKTVNSAGNAMVDRSEKFVEIVKQTVTHNNREEGGGTSARQNVDAEMAAAAVEAQMSAERIAAAEAQARARAEAEARAAEQAMREQALREQAAREQALREQAAREQLAREQAAREQLAREQVERDRAAQAAHIEDADEDTPFEGEGLHEGGFGPTEFDLPSTSAEEAVALAALAEHNGQMAGVDPATEDPSAGTARPAASAGSEEDEMFTEIDLSPNSEARVVMGRGGLVELQEAIPSAATVAAALGRTSGRRQPVAEDPFTEISLADPDQEPQSMASDSGMDGAARERQRAGFGEGIPAAAYGSTGEEEAFTEIDLSHPTPDPHYGTEYGHETEMPWNTMPSDTEYAAEPSAASVETAYSGEGTDGAPVISAGFAPTIDGAGSYGGAVAAVGGAAESDPAADPARQGVVVDVEAREEQLVDERSIDTEGYDPLKDLIHYHYPSVDLLEDYQASTKVSDEEIFENKTHIEETLKNFGIPIQKIKATVGPTVTLYEIVQAKGVKISKIQGLENDIAQSLKALGIRIIAPIPGKGTIGIEVPNRDKQIVSMYSAIRSQRFQESKAALPVVIGRTIQNECYVFDLAKMPHLLVAGATGQGKSVGLNAIITSLLYRRHPAELKFVLIDPKMVEFSLYSKIERHFLAKMESEDEAIITDPKKAVYTLNALCTEMDNRLELCKMAGTRNIAEYNAKFVARRLNPEKGHRFLPYIVVIVDEFADLIMTAREVEAPVMRLAQKARAIGIHLIIATQRPDVKVITGGIKANFPARMAFRVMQMIDSRTIIDQPGANQLIGRGDMLFSKDGELIRIQCALVETEEVERVVDYISRQQGYTSAYALPDYTPDSGEGGMGSEESSAPVKYDVLFGEIARDAVSGGQISTSMIQRNYEVGFNRAGRIMMQLERAGIVGRQQGAKPRDILFHDLPSLEAKLQDLGVF